MGTNYTVTVSRGKYRHVLRYRHMDAVYEFVLAVIRRYKWQQMPDVLVQDSKGRGLCRVDANYAYTFTRLMPPFYALALKQEWDCKHCGGGGYGEILHGN